MGWGNAVFVFVCKWRTLWFLFLWFAIGAVVSGGAAAGAAPGVLGQELPPSVLADLAQAVDAGRREGFLAVVTAESAARPGHAADIAAAAALLAPWLGDAVAEAVLNAVPGPGPAAPGVLAAVLSALDGRHSKAVARAVRQAAPDADAALLDGVETVFAEALAHGTPAGFLNAETVGLPPAVARAVAVGRAATARAVAWVRVWEGLAPVPAPGSGTAAGGVASGGPEAPPTERQEPVLESRFRVPSGS